MENDMGEHINKLAPDQLERLAILSEEMGEVSQMIGKILRHGYASRNPLDPKSVDNRTLLTRELGDVLISIRQLVDSEDVCEDQMTRAMKDKYSRMEQWSHYQNVAP